MYVKPTERQKEEIYCQLLNVTDIESFDKKAFADARGTNHQSFGVMIGQMRPTPSVYIDLIKRGFTDAQIPKWVKRPEAGPVAVLEPKPLPGLALKPAATPAATPATVTLARKML